MQYAAREGESKAGQGKENGGTGRQGRTPAVKPALQAGARLIMLLTRPKKFSTQENVFPNDMSIICQTYMICIKAFEVLHEVLEPP